MSKDVQSRHPGAHMCLQTSTRHMFDEEVSTYHSAKSSLTHGPVLRGRPSIFGGKGRVLPPPSGTSPPSGPSGTMGPPKTIPLPCKGPLLPSPRMQGQAAKQAAPSGVPVPPLEQPFADLTGLTTGILMPPLVGPSLPPQGGWATQPAAQAGRGTDAKSVAGSAAHLGWGQGRWPSPHLGPPRRTSDRPSGGFDSNVQRPRVSSFSILMFFL